MHDDTQTEIDVCNNGQSNACRMYDHTGLPWLCIRQLRQTSVLSRQADLQDPRKVEGLVLLQDELINLLVRLRQALQLLQHLSSRLGLLLLTSQNLLLLLHLQRTKGPGLHALIYPDLVIKPNSSWLS